MTPDDAPPPSRRALREKSSPEPEPTDEPVDPAPGTPTADELFAQEHEPQTPAAVAAAAAAPPVDSRSYALTWVDEATITAPVRTGVADLRDATVPYVTLAPDLLVDSPRRALWRSGILAPLIIVLVLVCGYAATTLLWPLNAVTPTATAGEITSAAAPATEPAWPAAGAAAVSVAGFGTPASSSDDIRTIASITKVVTALLVLDEMPLDLGEQGPEFSFTAQDSVDYWSYRYRGESALDVPVGGTLTEYQLLQGMLIGSANNYADRLAGNLWPSDQVFAGAAQTWLDDHGVPDVTIVDPTGIESGNTATPAALITLAQKALQNPVIAEIVKTKTVDLPGAGEVENTNDLLADAGVIGIKTGSLDSFNLLSAKEIAVGDQTVRMYASVLGQPDDDARNAATRALYARLQQELQPTLAVPAGTLAGSVTTAWGENVPVVTAGDATVILWNGASATAEPTLALGESRAAGDVVGSLIVTGAVDDATVDLELDADIEGPDAWWRLTHPLELLGLAD